MEVVSLCEALAKRWMKGQRPTVSGHREAWRHPEDAVRILDSWPVPVNTWNPNYLPYLKSVLWLHDVIEDGEHEEGRPITDQDLLSAGIPHNITRDVVHMSKRPSENKDAFLTRLFKEGSWVAKLCKCIDRNCNLHDGIAVFKDDRWARYVVETERHILPFADANCPWFAAEMRIVIAARPLQAEKTT